MIIVRLKGGLGNQLFQVAAGISLSQKLNVDLRIDVSALTKRQKEHFDLAQFTVSLDFASKYELKKFLIHPGLYKTIPKFIAGLKRRVYIEKEFNFQPFFFNLSAPVYLDGYFQSEKYFNNIREILLERFSVKDPFVKHLEPLKHEMSACKSASLHVRRGDYLVQKNLNIHGVLSAEYYLSAIDFLQRQNGLDKVYIFSDDIDWVRKNLNFKVDHEFISGKTQTAIEDFYLMSCCKYNIVANSSFSWWAAWLNTDPEKKIIAPINWFATKKLNDIDLIPETWIRM